MNKTILEILCCPYCAGDLRLASSHADRGNVRTGILTCDRHRFPILAGIPIFREDEETASTVKLVESGKSGEALLRLVRSDSQPLGGRLRSVAPRIALLPGLGRVDRILARRRVRRLIQATDKPVTFAAFVREVNPNGADYFTFRFSDPTFLAGLAIASIMQPGRRILDVGCGAGHLAYAVSNWLGLGPIAALDRTFRVLFLAKTFLLPEGEFVCCEADQSLPFRGGVFPYVFSSDALHYMAAKQTAANEMARVAGPQGTVILAHLHNKHVANPSPGSPLSPEDYVQLFPHRRVAVISDTKILDNFVAGRPLDLVSLSRSASHAGEPSISLVVSEDGAVFGTRELHFRRQRLRVNPLYRIRDGGSELRLSLEFPSAQYEAEFGGVRAYLPAEVAIAKRHLADRTSPEATSHLDDLAKRWILLDLPDHYI